MRLGYGHKKTDTIGELTLTLGGGGLGTAGPLTLSELRTLDWDRPLGPASSPLSDDIFPFIDTYGQSTLSDWPKKVVHDSDLAARKAEEDADLSAHVRPSTWSRY